MNRNLKKYLIITFAVGAMLLLFSGIAWAGWKRGNANYIVKVEDDEQESEVCTDGISFAFADKFNQSYLVVFYEAGQGPQDPDSYEFQRSSHRDGH